MSCCPGPQHGKPFDPDAELPCDADMARFGDEDDEFDTGYGRRDAEPAFGSPRAAGAMLVAKVLIGAMVLAACAGFLWIAR
jgi:hypothetical protein